MKLKNITKLLVASFILIITTLAIVNADPPSNPLEFNEGLVIDTNDFDIVQKGSNKTVHFHIFDMRTGLMIPYNESECHNHLYRIEPDYEDISGTDNFSKSDYGINLFINESDLDTKGMYGLNIRCNTTQIIDGNEVEKGGFAKYEFEVRDYFSTRDENTILWTCPNDWTFPIVFMIITLIMLSVAFTQNSMIFGILGSIMTIVTYLYIGACSPLFLTPILIVGLLMMFKFAAGGD